MLRTLIIALLLVTGCASTTIEKGSVYTSVTRAPIKGKDITFQAVGFRLDYDTAKITKLPPTYGSFDISLELYSGIVLTPQTGYTLGATAMLRYSYPIMRFRPYVEIGVGPNILSISTHEQEKSGFAFNDQIGVGTEINITEALLVFIGYRFSHLSHAGLRNTRNRGIESDTFMFGLTIKFH